MTTVLEHIREREQAATPGEWESAGMSVRVIGSTGGNAWHGAICNTIGGGYESRKADRVNVQARDNADFIANSRADMSLLLAVAEAAARAWPRMVGLFEFAALHGMTEPDPDIVALRAAIAPLLEEAE